MRTLMLSLACLAVSLAACSDQDQSQSSKLVERLPVIVTLDVPIPESAADFAEIRSTSESVLDQLRTILPAEQVDKIRVMQMLPILALEASPQTIAFILQIPEVQSIELDRKLKPAGKSGE